LARAGQGEQAEAIAAQAESAARSTADPISQSRALAQVAKSLASGGQYGQAEAIAGQAESVARSISDPVWQAQALAQVAGALTRAGEARPASRIAAATCAVGQWTIAVGPVLLLEPSAYTALARTLEERQ
jgi:hypothetical protein